MSNYCRIFGGIDLTLVCDIWSLIQLAYNLVSLKSEQQ